MAATDTFVISDYSDWLKEWYLPKIQMARKFTNVFLDDAVIKFDSEHIAGQYAYWPVEFPTMTGTGGRAENTANPIPDSGDFTRARVALQTHLVVAQLSLQLMKQSEGDRASFNPAVAQNQSTAMNGWFRNLNRMTLGTGDGKLCQIDTTVAGNSITVDNAWGISNTDAGSNANGAQFIFKNMRVNIFASDGTTQRTDIGASADGVGRITGITSRGSGDTSAIVTIDDDGSAADGDYFYIDGNNDGSSVYEPDGLQALISDSDDNYGNIDTGNYPDWSSWVDYGSTAGTVEPLTRTRMNRPWKDIQDRGGGNVNLIFCGTDTEETYLELADSMSITTNPKKLDIAGNWEGPSFRNATILSDPIYPETRMEYIDTNYINMVQNAPADYVPGDVGILQKVAGYLNYVSEYVWLFNMICLDRTKTGSLRDIQLIT